MSIKIKTCRFHGNDRKNCDFQPPFKYFTYSHAIRCENTSIKMFEKSGLDNEIVFIFRFMAAS